jgi:type VI secretion system Hcp family effector
MAVDIFVKLEGIPGESRDSRFKDCIEAEGLTWGSFMSMIDNRSNGWQVSGRGTVEPVVLIRRTDKATPKLFEYNMTARPIPEVTITFNRATGDKQKFLEIRLKNAVVSRINFDAGTNGLPSERVELAASEYAVTYTETDQKTGLPKGEVMFQWSMSANK